jgi:hypothetical protein
MPECLGAARCGLIALVEFGDGSATLQPRYGAITAGFSMVERAGVNTTRRGL